LRGRILTEPDTATAVRDALLDRIDGRRKKLQEQAVPWAGGSTTRNPPGSPGDSGTYGRSQRDPGSFPPSFRGVGSLIDDLFLH